MPAASASASAHAAATQSVFPVTRARVDHKRKVGLANAVAQGRLLYRVGTMSESELNGVRRLARDEVDLHSLHRAKEDARRREASKTRTNHWPDTVLAKQEAFLLRREAEKLEEQQRKETLLELEALQVEEERRQKQTRLALKLLEDDPRGRNVRSLTMLDTALKDRETQIAFKEHLRKKEEEEKRVEWEIMQRGKDEYLVKEQEEKFNSRARNVAEKNSHLLQMQFQIEERKKLRAEKKKARQEVERDAEEEVRENEAAEEEEKKKVEAIHAYNRSITKPAVTKHDRLLQRIQRDEHDEVERAIQEEKVESLKRTVIERIKKKRDHFEKCKAESTVSHIEESEKMRHKERTQNVFECRGTSMIDHMTASEDRQKQRAMAERKRLIEESRRAAEGIVEELPQGVQRAAVHRAGFMNDDEARAYQEEMRGHPARLLAEKEAEAARLRAEAELLQRINLLQMKEKKENEQREADADAEAQRRRQQTIEEDDLRYAEYVKSQLPPDMDPYLYEKAIQLRY